MKLVCDIAVTATRHRPRLSFSPARLFAAGENGCWFDPSDLASLFEDASGTIPATVNGRIGRMLDKSGNGHHAIQTNSWARPFLRVDAEGRHYLDFDGIDDTMQTTLTGLGLGDSRATLACGYRANGSVGYILNTAPSTSSLAEVALGVLFQSGNSRVILGGEVTSRALAALTRHCVTAVFDRTGPSGQVFWDREAAQALGSGSAVSDNPLWIGSRGSAVFFAGRVYGVIARMAQSNAAELARLQAYICTKTGVPQA
jgi:hypothetical protein